MLQYLQVILTECPANATQSQKQAEPPVTQQPRMNCCKETTTAVRERDCY